MAAQMTTRPAPLGAITAYRIASFITDVASALIAWNDERMTRNALAKLSNRELDDIGLCRGDIDAIAQRRF